MQRSDFRFLDRLRVRWAEVDLQKIVFNGHYLLYFDTAVAGYWRALALPYHAVMERLHGDLFVRKATLEYEGSARYDEQLHTGIRCARIGNSSMVFTAAVFRGEQLLVRGELVYVFADPSTQTSLRVPDPLRDVLLGFEAGQPMADVRIGTWQDLCADAQDVRHAVFVREQAIAADLVVDAGDADALHAVAYNRLGMALAGGRLLVDRAGTARIGRMATLGSVRGAGLGQAVLNGLMAAARERGVSELLLYAQATAVEFYARNGFKREGEAFMEAGLPHVEMRRML